MKRVYASATGGVVAYTRFVYHGGNVAFETDSAETLGLRYTWGPAADDLLAIRDAGGNHYYVVQDRLRGVRGLVKRDGTWQRSLRYGAYGTVLVDTAAADAPTWALRYRWTGREWDAELGWYFHRSRYYDPAQRRFVQEDAIGYAGGGNLHAYPANPGNMRDPSGLFETYVYDENDAKYFTNCWAIDCRESAWQSGESWGSWWGGAGFGFAILTRLEQTATYSAYLERYNDLRASENDPYAALGFLQGATRALEWWEFDRVYSGIVDLKSRAAETGDPNLHRSIDRASWLLSGGRIAVNDLFASGRIFAPFPVTRILLVNSRLLMGAFPSEVSFGLVHEDWHFWAFWHDRQNWQDECRADAYARAATGWNQRSGGC